MSEGQKVHRLLGLLYGDSKKAAFYEDLAEDFNDGLWFGKVDETEVKSLCAILVRDELAHYVAGQTAAASYASDQASSKGIAITGEAFTAYINKKYLAGQSAGGVSRLAIGLPLVVVVAAGGYFFNYNSKMNDRLEDARLKYGALQTDMKRLQSRLDSISAANAASRKILEDRIKACEAFATELTRQKEELKKKVSKRR